MADPTPEPYVHSEYPKALYLGAKVKIVLGEAAEKAAVKAGWLTSDARTVAELPPETTDDGEPVAVEAE
jgi:hypothetical protein